MAQYIDPYPQYPFNKDNVAKFSFTCRWEDNDKLMTQGFRYIWGAHYFINYMINNDSFKWETPDKIRLKSGMTIHCLDLEKIIEHKPTILEAQWIAPTPYKQMYEAWRNKGRSTIIPLDEHQSKRTTISDPKPVPRKASARSQEHPGASTRKRLATPTTERAKPVRASSAGLTAIGDIAKALNMHPRDARAILRQTKTPKHEGGWAWPRSQVDKIKSILTKNKKRKS